MKQRRKRVRDHEIELQEATKGAPGKRSRLMRPTTRKHKSGSQATAIQNDEPQPINATQTIRGNYQIRSMRSANRKLENKPVT